jgi:hypothetical protein
MVLASSEGRTPRPIRWNVITALQSDGLRSKENYVNEKLRCRCDAAARRLARQAWRIDGSNSHSSIETAGASHRAKMLRCPQTAKLQAHNEDTLNCRRKAHIEGCGNLRRNQAAVSTGRSMGDIDRPIYDIEALLSCPHANPKILSKTSMPGIQSSDWLRKGL